MILACRVNAFTTATRHGHFGPLSGSGFERLLYAHFSVPFPSYWFMIGPSFIARQRYDESHLFTPSNFPHPPLALTI